MKRFAFWILLIFSNSLVAQTTFNHRFNFGYPAAVMTNIIPTDSCYYATAIVADSLFPNPTGSLFLKLDLEGNVLHSKAYLNNEKTLEMWQNVLILNADNTFTTSATSWEGGDRTILLLKLNEMGDTTFSKEYFHPSYPDFTRLHDIDFVVLPDSTFAFCGMALVQENPGNIDFHIIKADKEGEIEWQKTIGNQRWDFPFSMIYDSINQEIIVGGIKTTDNSATENYDYQNYIFRLDSLGNVVWNYLSLISDGLKGGARDMVVLEDGSLVVASGIGYEQERTSVNVVWQEKAVFKINYDKEVLWEKEFKGLALDGRTGLSNIIRLEDESGFIIAGMGSEDLPGPNSYITRGWITKISNEGDSLWTRQYIGIEDNTKHEQEIQDIKQTPDGGFILCGESKNWEDNDPVPQQAWLLKLDEHGCLVPGCNTIDNVIEKDDFQFELKLFPNPASDFLNVFFRDLTNFRNYQFSIYDNLGRLVQEFNYPVTESTLMIDLVDFPSGVYFLNLSAEGTILKTERFLKTKKGF